MNEVIRTFAVSGGHYGAKGLKSAGLTHSCDASTLRPLCGKVKASSILDDDLATSPNEPPTCKVCLRLDKRFREAELGPSDGIELKRELDWAKTTIAAQDARLKEAERIIRRWVELGEQWLRRIPE